MIAQRSINSHRRGDLVENIHIVIHFIGNIINQVPGKKNKVRFFIQDLFNTFFYCLFISKASTMNIGDMDDPQSFECCWQVTITEFCSFDLVTVFITKAPYE